MKKTKFTEVQIISILNELRVLQINRQKCSI
jgi:hypothetical protein